MSPGLRIHVVATALLSLLAAAGRAQQAGWPTYGGDPGGRRYSAAKQITRANVARLQPAWTFSLSAQEVVPPHRSGSFEATPILFDGLLYVSTETDRVIALDPATGAQRWAWDADIDWDRRFGVTSRGVASWTDSASGAESCARRIFLGTLDGRLVALDAADGRPCADFGANGAVDLTQGVDYRAHDNYSVTSPPAVVGDVVVVGSSIEDNYRVDVELGDVRGFDARTGRLLWTWEPIPWAKQQKLRTGAANTWSAIAADPEHGLVFLPTSSPSPDYYGGLRPGDDRDADSIVALDARSGRKVWAFQIVHHDIWDYDLPSEPLLFYFRGGVPAVAVTTKMGMIFVLNRLTGEPLYPIHERPVPVSDVPGEHAWPTQPFQDVPTLSPLTLDTRQRLGTTQQDDAFCRALLGRLRYDGLYTPPSMRGTVLFPGNLGGVNWGSAALDPATGVLYANTNRLPFVIRLLQRRPARAYPLRLVFILPLAVFGCVCVALAWRSPRRRGLLLAAAALSLAAASVCFVLRRVQKPAPQTPWAEPNGVLANRMARSYGNDAGAPWIVLREPMLAPSGAPCNPAPWGTVSAVNLNTAQAAWEAPLGARTAGEHLGSINLGGPMVTAGGLVFTAASQEPLLRAFDAATGAELWAGKLPAPALATPMSYTLHGRQYVVIAAGGRHTLEAESPDAVVAFALPETLSPARSN